MIETKALANGNNMSAACGIESLRSAASSLKLHQEWVAECVSRGLFITSHHNHFINAAITREDIALGIDIADDAFSVVAQHHPELGLIR